jgi:hypothetical protein
MRTIVDLPAEQLEMLGRICQEDKISRAEAIRRAVDAYAKQRGSPTHAAFGLWSKRKEDGLEYEDRMRAEWERGEG